MRSIIGIGLLGTVLLSGCVFLDGSFHQKQVNSFVLRTTDNPTLRREYVGEVLDNKILIDVPDYVDAHSLVPHIEWEGVALEVNQSPYVETRSQNFLEPMNVDVMAKDNLPRTYAIEVSIVPPLTTKEIIRLSLGSSSSSTTRPMDWWSPFPTLEGERVFEVPYVSYAPSGYVQPFDLNSLKFDVGNTGVWVELDGHPLQGVATADFSVPHTVAVVAEDLSRQEHVVKVQYATDFWIYLYSGPTYLDAGRVRNGLTSIQFWVPPGVPRDQLRLIYYQDLPYPVTIGGTPSPVGEEVPVDLSQPLILTVAGPYLSQTFTLSVAP